MKSISFEEIEKSSSKELLKEFREYSLFDVAWVLTVRGWWIELGEAKPK